MPSKRPDSIAEQKARALAWAKQRKLDREAKSYDSSTSKTDRRMIHRGNKKTCEPCLSKVNLNESAGLFDVCNRSSDASFAKCTENQSSLEETSEMGKIRKMQKDLAEVELPQHPLQERKTQNARPELGRSRVLLLKHQKETKLPSARFMAEEIQDDLQWKVVTLFVLICVLVLYVKVCQQLSGHKLPFGFGRKVDQHSRFPIVKETDPLAYNRFNHLIPLLIIENKQLRARLENVCSSGEKLCT